MTQPGYLGWDQRTVNHLLWPLWRVLLGIYQLQIHAPSVAAFLAMRERHADTWKNVLCAQLVSAKYKQRRPLSAENGKNDVMMR